MFGVGLVIPKEHTQESYEDFVRTVSKASLEYDYNTLYNALWPHIKNVYKKHYNDLVNDMLLNKIQYELSQLYKTATMYVLDECIGVFNLAFKSCIHAAKHWDFDLEES